MKRSLLRVLPAATALVGISFAAFAPALRAREAAPASASVIGCDAGNLAGTDAARTIAPYTGVLQPFDGTAPVASCSLAVAYPYYSHSTLSIVRWDPLALAPDPLTLALRTRAYNSSDLQYNHARAVFTPPIVVREVPGVAESSPATLALRYEVTDPWNAQDVRYWTDGPAGMPVAYSFSGAAPAPLAGAHPVLAATFCPGAETQDLRVLQAVTTTSTLLGFGAYEYLQRFQVPLHSAVQWVELAFGYNDNSWPIGPGKIALYDSADLPVPADGLPAPIFEADFVNYVTAPQWATHYQTPPAVRLEPHHDYWLLVRSAYDYPLYVRTIDSGISPEFQAGIGPFYSRTTANGSWVSEGGRALCFRLLGEPGPPPLAVTPPAASRLRVGIEPNPARGAALVRWSGARGSVRIEVLDPRGRRVAQYESAGAEGAWRWRGAADDGRPCAPGVYFVRAVDDAGARGGARVVLIR